MRARASVAVVTLLAGCAPDLAGSSEHVGYVTTPLVGGRESPENEDYGVLVETVRDGRTWRCSGTLVAPSIVVTARHCVLKDEPPAFDCSRDGEALNPTGGIAGTVIEGEHVTVTAGRTLPSARTAVVRELFTATAPSLCRDDIAFAVLASPLDAPIAPIRTTPARVGERITLIGWGREGDDAGIADERRARDDIPIEAIGPGLIPPRSFAFPGGTGCFGDSGGGAFVEGELVGVYSRIDGGSCELVVGRNIGTLVAPFRELAEKAFAKTGTPSPWESPPTEPMTDPVGDEEPAPAEATPQLRRGTSCQAAPGEATAPAWVATLACAALAWIRRRSASTTKAIRVGAVEPLDNGERQIGERLTNRSSALS